MYINLFQSSLSFIDVKKIKIKTKCTTITDVTKLLLQKYIGSLESDKSNHSLYQEASVSIISYSILQESEVFHHSEIPTHMDFI